MEAGCRNPERARDFKLLTLRENLAAPQGFEPRYADPESAVLPLNEGAAWQSEVLRRLDSMGCPD